jgi:hypothetical protein
VITIAAHIRPSNRYNQPANFFQAGIVTILCLLFMKESYAPILLERKAAKLRKSTGNQQYRSKLSSEDDPRTALVKALIRPTKMFLMSPIVSIFVVRTPLAPCTFHMCRKSR